MEIPANLKCLAPLINLAVLICADLRRRLMSTIYKISLYSFVVLTIFSAVILGYTIYLTFGVSWATHKIEVSLLDVVINENNETSFLFAVYNPSYIHLDVVLLRARVYYNSNKIAETIVPFGNFSLPSNTEKTIVVRMRPQSQISSIKGYWAVDLTLYLKAPLLETARIPRLASKQVDV